MNNVLTKIVMLLVLAALSSRAMGTCSVGVSVVNIGVPSSISINAAGIANGSPLTGWVGLTNTSHMFNCTNPAPYQTETITGVAASGAGSYTESGVTYTVYPTGVAGVGVVIAVRDPNRSNWAPAVQSASKDVIYCACAAWGLVSQARFIKTGSVSSGRFSVARRQVATLRIPAFGGYSSQLYINGTTLNITAPTCNLSAGDVNRTVTLDTFQLKDIPASGSFGYKTFSISANCSNATTARFLFQGTAWSLDGYRFNNTGTATGVGVQLASTINGQSVTVQAGGDASSRTRTVSVANGTATLPMAAAYWRVGAVTPGTVSTRITVTLSYD